MKKGPLDKAVTPKGPPREVSQAVFAQLFSQVIHEAQARSSRVDELEEKLATLGAHVGARVAELAPHRSRPGRRETSVVAMLSFIVSVVWKQLFGRAADNLEKSVESPLEYLVVDLGPNVGQWTSVPKGLETLSVAAFAAGVVRGVLEAGGFPVDSVQAHNVPLPSPRTVIQIRFAPHTIARDHALSSS